MKYVTELQACNIYLKTLKKSLLQGGSPKISNYLQAIDLGLGSKFYKADRGLGLGFI